MSSSLKVKRLILINLVINNLYEERGIYSKNKIQKRNLVLSMQIGALSVKMQKGALGLKMQKVAHNLRMQKRTLS